MKDGEESWERHQQHRAGDPGLPSEATHEAKHPSNVAARVLDEEIVPERNILSFVSQSHIYPPSIVNNDRQVHSLSAAFRSIESRHTKLNLFPLHQANLR